MTRIVAGIDTSNRILAAGLLAAGTDGLLGWQLGWTAVLPAYLYLGAVASIVTVTDLTTRRIPNVIIYPSYVVTIGLLAAASALHNEWPTLGRAVLALAGVGACYLALAVCVPGQLGFGDVKLAALLALALGWWGWPAVTTATVAAWLAALAAVAWPRLHHRRRSPTVVPLGPYLCLGAVAAILTTR